MTMTPPAHAGLPLRVRIRATSKLPPPAQRRAIRDSARLSREDVARELRAAGLHVTATAVAWWEKERTDGGFDPRPMKALAYGRLLEQIRAEVESLSAETTEQSQK